MFSTLQKDFQVSSPIMRLYIDFCVTFFLSVQLLFIVTDGMGEIQKNMRTNVCCLILSSLKKQQTKILYKTTCQVCKPLSLFSTKQKKKVNKHSFYLFTFCTDFIFDVQIFPDIQYLMLKHIPLLKSKHLIHHL